jgi:23S rRNA (cytosine1962-C5)-methyltransferase
MTDAQKLEMFHNRLVKVYRHLGKLARKMDISCFRIYDRDLPEFPLIIDIYADKVYVAEYDASHTLTEEQHKAWLDNSIATIATVTAIPTESIYLKQRKRKEHRQDQYQKTGEAMVFFTVKEGGLSFKINLSDYLDTGLFLDHRVTRGMVREASGGKDVLNLFCYTASFSVYAAAGGARTVVSVDLSKTYLSWSAENLALNGFTDPSRYTFVHADVLQYLDELAPESFDLIVLDPPTFSNSKRMDDFLDIQRDHVKLIRQCLRVLRPGGVIYFSTNYTRFVPDMDNIPAQVKDITKATTPFDFTGKLRRWCYRIEKPGS